MKRHRWKKVLVWSIVSLLLLLFFFLQDSLTALYVLVFWVLLPIICLLLHLYVRSYLNVTLRFPESAAKEQEEEAYLFLENTCKLPALHVSVGVLLENVLTKEKEETTIFFPIAAGGIVKERISFRSKYCGYLTAKVTKLSLMDWFELLAVQGKKEQIGKEAKIVVLPDTFTPQIILDPAGGSAEEVEEWSPFRKGNDQTETYGLREYAPGDSLKQIHWKLSSKRGQLIVREASLPEIRTLLLFWEKETCPAKEMDAMAEVVASTAQMLWEQGETFTLGWQQEEESYYVPVSSEEDLTQAIARMLKGVASDASKEQETYAKVIYFGTERQALVDADEDSDGKFGEAQITQVLCGKTQSMEPGKMVYRAETYAEDLSIMEV